jgi:muramoyltetrapeptide carboxypeptidase LdcA involved in peptidoglycan recycling
LTTVEELQGLTVHTAGIKALSKYEVVSTSDEQNRALPQYVAKHLIYLLKENAHDAIWLATHDSELVPRVAELVIDALRQSVPEPHHPIIIGSGRATPLLNALAHLTGLVTYLGCEPWNGHEMTRTFMSTPASMANLVWRFSAERREHTILLTKDPGRIVNAPSSPTRITGRCYGGDISGLDTFFKRPERPALPQGSVLVIESTKMPKQEIQRILERWREDSLISQVAAVVLGGIPHGNMFMSYQHTVFATLLSEALAHTPVPVVLSRTLSHHTVPLFLPIGGEVTVDVSADRASITILTP